MVDVLLDTPPSEPMTEVHIWIGHHADGTESMMACDFPLVLGITRHMPLMHSVHATAELFGDIARKVQKVSLETNHKIVRVELRTFRAVRS